MLFRSGPEPPLLEVEVFYRKDGSEHRAAGARVVVSANLAEEDFDPISQEGGSPSGPEDRPPSVTTWEFNCDAEGRARLPLGSIAWRTRRRWASFLVRAAAQDRRFASENIRVELDRQGRFQRAQPPPVLERMERLRIELHPNRSITVFVHDGSGRGVEGVPVQLFNTASWHRTSGPKRLLEPFPGISPLRTEPDGRCTFDFPSTPEIDRFRTCCVAGFSFPHGDHQRWSRKVTEEHFSGRQVELELPPTGSVEVVIEGGPGSGSVNKESWVQIEDATNAFFFRLSKNWITSNSWQRRSSLGRFKKTVDHAATFDRVGLGLELEVAAVMAGTWGVRTKKVPGPTCPGERVRILLPPPSPDPVVSGVVLDLDGRPLAKKGLLFFGGSLGTGLTGLRIEPYAGEMLGRGTTDASGRFSVALPPAFARGTMKELRLVPTAHEHEEGPPACVIELPPAFSEGTHFLGEHRLERPPLLARGIVVDPDGRRIEGAEVFCLKPRTACERPWSRIPGASTLTGAEGDWAIYMHVLLGEIKVQAEKGDAVSPLLLAIPGAQGLRLVLEPAGVGSIDGRILVDDPLHLERGMIRIELIPRVLPDEGLRRHLSRTISKDGSVRWTNVPAGLYEFRASVIGDPAEPLALVAGLRVEAGKVNDELALKPIDLRGKTEEVKLVAREPSGNLILAHRLLIRNAPGSRIDSGDGAIFFLKRAGDAPIAEVVPLEGRDGSYLPAQVKCPGTEVEVVLQPKPAGPNAGPGDRK